MSVFSTNQLKNPSIGCLIVETAVEYRSSAALLNCRSSLDSPFFCLTGVKILELLAAKMSSKSLSI
jgi:hypothetical protein